jgi:hypothetical protein
MFMNRNTAVSYLLTQHTRSRMHTLRHSVTSGRLHRIFNNFLSGVVVNIFIYLYLKLYNKFLNQITVLSCHSLTLQFCKATGALGPTVKRISQHFSSSLSRQYYLSHIFSHATRWSRTMSVRLTKENLILASKMRQQRKWSYFLMGTWKRSVRVDGLKAWLLAVTERQEGAAKAERPVEIRPEFPKGDRAKDSPTRRSTLTSYHSAHTWKLLTPRTRNVPGI